MSEPAEPVEPAGPAEPVEPAEPVPPQEWTFGPTTAPEKQPGLISAQKGQALVLLVVIAALLGVLAAWLLYPGRMPSPHFLGIWISEYRDPIPVNPWAEQGRRAFLTIPWRDDPGAVSQAFTSQQRNLLVQELENLARKKAGDAVVIYLGAHARTDQKGEVFLLPADTDLSRPKTWLSMADVFRHLKACPARHKLLLLDVLQPFTEPRAGVLANDVADRLDPALQAAVEDDPRLLVLSACAPGQVSLASEELGHTVFAYYLLQGLGGRADGYGPGGKRDQRIHVRELADYVTGHVDRWAWVCRESRQTPRLYGPAEDFPLVLVPPEGAPPEGTALERAYLDWLHQRWELRDEWWNDDTFRAAPEVYRDLEDELLRAERRWRGGVSPRRVEQDLALRIAELKQRRERLVPAVRTAEPLSLARAVARGRKPPDPSGDARRELHDLLGRHATPSVPKPNPEDTRLKKEQEKFLQPFADAPFDLAWMVFDVAAAERALRPEHLRFLVGLLPVKAGSPQYAEITFLRSLAKLAEGPKEDPKAWPAEAVHHALRCTGEREKALAGDRRTSSWVEGVRAGADRVYNQGVRLLFAPDQASRDKAGPLLGEALRLYEQINRALQSFQEAEYRRDVAKVFLFTWSPYLEFAPDHEGNWAKALRDYRALEGKLARLVARRAGLDADFRELDDATATLRNALKLLEQPLNEENMGRLIRPSKGGKPADWHHMAALLETPWLDADQRLELWNAWRALGGRLDRAARELDEADEVDRPLRDAPPAFQPERAKSRERERAQLRERVARLLAPPSPEGRD